MKTIFSTPSFPYDRTVLLNLIRRWGGSASDAVLDPACQIFTTEKIEGVIGYRNEAGCAVVYGDPICAPDNIAVLVQAFHAFCQEQNRRIIYLGASSKFSKWAMATVCKASIEFGDDYFLDPRFDDPKKGAKGSLVRRKLRHALMEEVLVNEYLENNFTLEESIEAVGAAWLKARQGPQMYVSHVHLFENRIGKRWFYAQQHGKIVGVLLLNQLQAQQGWLLNHLMFTPEAPHGTPELLVMTAFETLCKENCCYLTFGYVPDQEIREIVGLSPLSAWLCRKGFKAVDKIFHLAGHKMFWEKFQPQKISTYLLFSHSKLGLKELLSLKRATNVAFF